MCTYLHGPREGGMYYFRRPIAERLRPIIGQREWYHSLKTKDRAEAKKKVALETVRTGLLLDAAEKALTDATAEAMGQVVEANRAQTEERNRIRAEEEWADFEERQARERQDRIAAQAEQARELRTRITGSTARMAPEDAVIARAIREAEEAAAVWRARFLAVQAGAPAGGLEDSQSAEAHLAMPSPLGKSDGAQRVSTGKSEGVAITALFEAYAAQPNGPKSGTVDQWRPIIRHLIAFLGHDDAQRVTSDDLLRWRQQLRSENGPQGKPRSAKTINGSWLSAISVTFGYGYAERLLPTNPAKSVPNIRADRKVKLREKSLTRDEQKTILTATLQPPSERVSPEKALTRRWVPWICAYSGARVNEITQLRKEDFEERDGIWCIRVTPEAGTQKTDEARLVPVHEHLIAQGLRQVVDTAKDGPLFYAPNNARGGVRALNEIAGQRLAEWVRELGVTDKSIKPNHAWRHTFKTIAISAGMEERAMDAIEGHASKGVGRNYGHNEMPALAAQLAKFPRYEFSDGPPKPEATDTPAVPTSTLAACG
jgi:integrase